MGKALEVPSALPDLAFGLADPSGAALKVSVSGPECEMATQFKYTHRYLGFGSAEGKEPVWGVQPDVVCEWTLVVWYHLGAVSEVSMSMHVIIPSRLGQRYIAGMDVSPGAKTYFNFEYEKTADGSWRLRFIEKDSRGRIDLDELVAKSQTAMLQPIEFPFPIPDRIQQAHRDDTTGTWYGEFQVPFRYGIVDVASGHFVDEIKHVGFPKSIRKYEVPT